MGKLLAILGGGDWYDASVEHLLLNDGVNLDKQKKLYEAWIEEAYFKRFRNGDREGLRWISFVDYLIENDLARRANNDDVIVFFD